MYPEFPDVEIDACLLPALVARIRRNIALDEHLAMVMQHRRYHMYRRARDIVRQAEYLERHGYRNHPTLTAIKASARARMYA